MSCTVEIVAAHTTKETQEPKKKPYPWVQVIFFAELTKKMMVCACLCIEVENVSGVESWTAHHREGGCVVHK
jgi:hypothetical protein